jgi:two-component system OmpR family response regulator
MSALPESDASDASPPKRLLLCDPDDASRALLDAALRAWGYLLEASADTAALEAAHEGLYELLLLDPQDARGRGWQRLGELRTRSRLPVLALLSDNAVLDRVLALELGADAVCPKPRRAEDLPELQARLQALLRRRREELPLQFGRWRLDTQSRRLCGPNGFSTALAPAEYRLLRAFLQRPHSILHRQELLDLVRGEGEPALVRHIDLLVSRLRQKLSDDAREPRLIRTVRGLGYLFEPPEA